MMDQRKQLLELINLRFPDTTVLVHLSLEDGDQIDGYYKTASQFINQEKTLLWREVTDSYLQDNRHGILYLDSTSWLGYLPALLYYALNHGHERGDLVIDIFLSSLRPGYSHFEKYILLSQPQQQVVTSVLEYLGLDSNSAFQADALQVIQERDDAIATLRLNAKQQSKNCNFK